MNRWNPAARARNLVERIRGISDDVVALRREVRDLAGALDAAHVEAIEQRAILLDLGRELALARPGAARAAARATLQRAATRVVFLVHNRDAWDSLGDVVSIMRDSVDFDPIVITIPHHYGGESEQRGEGRLHDFLTQLGVPHLRIRKNRVASARELLFALDPDIIFRQSQWDADVDEAFSATNLSWTRLALIPYETMNPTVNVPFGDPPINSAVDQQWHRAAWLVFCANDESLAIAQRDSLTGGRQFRALGHPKADALRRTAAQWPFPESETRSPRIAWSAHHSILDGWNDFGLFPSAKDDMLSWARDAPETEFVFMYHPLLPGTIRRGAGPLSVEEFRAWLAEWESLPNTRLWRGPYAPVLAATDVLVTDGPSMITESQLLEVPTVFLERADHIPFNPIGDLIVSGVHRVADVASARQTAERILAAKDPLASRQKSNVATLFGAPGAAQRIVDALRSEITAETARRRG